MTNDVTTEVVDGRRSVYGEPSISFPLVAQVWSGILGTEVRPDQVPLLLIGYKLVRASECPEYSDNIDDVEGYAKIFREVMGEDLINARSVAEFLEIKERRAAALAAAESRAQVPQHQPHRASCHDWNERWDRVKWGYVCVCDHTPAERDAISRERALTELATPALADGELGELRP